MAQPQAAPWQTMLEENAPDLLKNVADVREAVLQEGALSLKVKTMMTMLCDALLGHADGVANIANRARAAGATEDEIAETVGVAFVFGGVPARVTGANAFRK